VHQKQTENDQIELIAMMSSINSNN